MSIFTSISLLVMGIILARRHSSEWDVTYLHSAMLLLHRGDIYNGLSSNTYPPFSALLFVLFTLPPIHLARAAWFAICAVSLLVLINTTWRLSGGAPIEPLGEARSARRADIGAFLVGQLCVLQFAMNALTHVQTDLLIAALLALGCAAIAERRFLHAAVWIGLSAAFKATPLLFSPYLLYRKQWKAALLLPLIAIGANLLPNAIPPPGGGVWLRRWYTLYLRPMTGVNYTPGDWKNDLNNNQSLAGAASRWLQTSWRDDSDSLNSSDKSGWSPTWLREYLRDHHPDWTDAHLTITASGQTVRAAFAAFCLLAILPLPFCIGLPGPQSIKTRLSAPPTLDMLECGLVLLLMLLLSPNSSRAHFCILYLPAFCVGRIAFAQGASIWLRSLLGLAALCSTVSIHVRLPFTYDSEQLLLWLGMVMWTTIFLLLATYLAMPLIRSRNEPVVGTATRSRKFRRLQRKSRAIGNV